MGGGVVRGGSGRYVVVGVFAGLRLWRGGTLPLHVAMVGCVVGLLALLVLGCMAVCGLVMLISALWR